MNKIAMELPFKEIDNYPKHIDAHTVLCRMLEGLGYRLHWATQGLSEKDLSYKPSPEAMNTWETIEHIAYLIHILDATFHEKCLERGVGPKFKSLEDFRHYALTTIQELCNLLRGQELHDLEHLKLKYQAGSSTLEYPFWHLINGPISDAIYHIGQIVSFRRTCGNPINEKVNVFMGKNRP